MTAQPLVPIAITMPKLSDSMEEGTVVKWLKAPGDTISRGDALVEVETDKATMTYEAERDGVLGELLVAEGQAAALGAPIARLLVEDVPRPKATVPPAAATPPLGGGPAASSGDAPAPARAASAGGAAVQASGSSGTPVSTAGSAAAPASPAPASSAGSAAAAPTSSAGGAAAPTSSAGGAAAPTSSAAGGRVSASPVARRVAAELGVALERLRGSGPRGRIVRADVLIAAEQARPVVVQAVPAGPEDTRVELSATQRTIARRMVASRTEIPEFTLTAELDMTSALALRRQLSALQLATRVSVNDLVVKAAAIVLREQPGLNASWSGDHVVRHGEVNVGIAVAAEDALIVPVIRDADRLHLAEIAAQARALGSRARAREIVPDDLRGATFTITNLGMFGVLSFDAVIDAPQAAILAVGTVVRRPTFDETGAVVGRDLMQVSLSCDHRVVYGADAARFLERLRAVLESPMTLLMPSPGTEPRVH